MILYELSKVKTDKINNFIKHLLLEGKNLSDEIEDMINRHIIPTYIHLAKIRYTMSVKWDFNHWIHKEIIPSLSKVFDTISGNKKIKEKRLIKEIKMKETTIIGETAKELEDYKLIEDINYDYLFKKLWYVLNVIFANRRKNFDIVKQEIVKLLEELRDENYRVERKNL